MNHTMIITGIVQPPHMAAKIPRASKILSWALENRNWNKKNRQIKAGFVPKPKTDLKIILLSVLTFYKIRKWAHMQNLIMSTWKSKLKRDNDKMQWNFTKYSHSSCARIESVNDSIIDKFNSAEKFGSWVEIVLSLILRQ